jgi:hypothetical protein
MKNRALDIHVDDTERTGKPDGVNRRGSQQQAVATGAMHPDQPICERCGHGDGERAPATGNEHNGPARPVRATAWYAPAHYGKGKATQAPRTT